MCKASFSARLTLAVTFATFAQRVLYHTQQSD